ncbi:hypothetical protein EXIGLDRAFT_730321 [Exidia glandulosa HHB12029]|uniref:DUF3480 domain-containing protein n=1 Tax=Exidia glandulosa HHB12029 TaxID=1314781 RepID=A0A165C819_EXIGL|nr:hypothetical protein EXIGLDRAFT_730321 [Exidia glandulosa HHB12029]
MAAAALEPLEVVLSDELTALVHRHKIATRTEGEIDCLTIVSRGLAIHGQKEVVWTVRDYYNGVLPNEPLRWYDMLLKYAKEGRIVDAYGVTEFTAKGWFGRDDIRAIVYMPPQPIPSLPGTALPQSRLHAIPLTAPERGTSLLRALCLLGYSTRYFPFPPWFDAKRPTTITEEQLAESVLSKAACLRVSGISATRRTTSGVPEVILRIRPGAIETLRAAVEASPFESVLGLEMELHEDADSCMVWVPGSTSLQAIGSGDTMDALGMCFVLFCPQQDHVELRQVEDGYVVFLTDELWTRIREAFTRRTPLFLPADPGGTSLRVEWLEESLATDASSEVTLNVDHIAQSPTAHVFLDSVTLQDLGTPPTAGHVLSVQAYTRAALSALLAVVPADAEVDVPRDVGPDGAEDEDEERWVLATLEFAQGGALKSVGFVVSPEDGRVDIAAMRRVLESVEMAPGTMACKFQVVLRLWRKEVAVDVVEEPL